MRICFVIPPSKSPDKVPERVYGCTFTFYRQPELPMFYAAAVLREAGHEVSLRDFSDDSSRDGFEQWVREGGCDAYVFHTVLLAESIDQQAGRFIIDNTDSHVIYFGPHPTLKPAEFLFDERCVVARGEAEYIIRDAVDAIAGGSGLSAVKGVSYLQDGKMVENETYGIIEDLDSLPFPARDLVASERDDFFNPKLPGNPVTLILTSRGCSFRCYYCVPNAISWARELEWKRFNDGHKPPVKLRSPENVAAEFRAVKEQGYRSVSVVDDMFLYGGKKRIMAICELLREVGLPFGMLARSNFVLDEELVAALAAAGCVYVDIGIESMDQEVLDDIKKDIDVATVGQAIEILNRHGIEPKANILFGASPKETTASMKRTVKEVSAAPLNYCMFSIATPFPGTEFAEIAEREGWTVKPDIDDLENNLSPTDRALVSYPNLSKKDMEKTVKWANRSFYLRPRRIWFYLRKVTSFKALKDLISTAWKVTR